MGYLSSFKPSYIKSYKGFSMSITFLSTKINRKYRCLPTLLLKTYKNSQKLTKEHLKMKERDTTKSYGNKYLFTVQTKHTFYVPNNQGLAKSYQLQPSATCMADDACTSTMIILAITKISCGCR